MNLFEGLRGSLAKIAPATPVLALVSVGVVAHAQGLMPIPDISGAGVTSEAALVSGQPWGGMYEYRYAISSPAAASGTIWLLKVDVSAQERQGENYYPPATYPVQGGTQFVPMLDDVELLAPFFGLRGPEVMVVGQQAPGGWNGGINIQGYVQFSASDTSFGVTPGSSQSGFVISFPRPPTIRRITLTPHWILTVEDHNTVTDQDLNDAIAIVDSLPVVVDGLGPLDIEIGGWQHYSRLFTDIARAEFLGWATDTTFVDSIESALGSAQDNAFVGNNGLALADLESIFDIFDAADPSNYRQEFRQLVELNVAALIQILPSAYNTYIPVFSATPERADLVKRDTFTLTMRYFNSALEGNPPISGLRVLVRCLENYPCANTDDLIPGAALQFDSTGELQFSYTGENIGTDYIEVVENDNEAFRQLAVVQVNWSADADLVVPAFVPPIIFASEGSTIYVTDRTENIGSGDAGESTITRYFISDSSPVDIGTATVLGERIVPPLSAGASDDSVEVEFTIPAEFPAEANYLAACADAGDVVAELYEDNNCSFSELVRQFDAVGYDANEPVNTAPVAEDLSVDTNRDTPVDVMLTAQDADGDTLTFAVVSGPDYGDLTGDALALVYTPDPGFVGVDRFTYIANDGTVDSNLATVSITISSVNSAPIANDQSVSTDRDVPVLIALFGQDDDGDSLSYSVQEDPTNGILTGTAPDLTYTPDAGFEGADSFTFIVNDGMADSNVATVSIEVVDDNVAPTANDQSVSTDQDVPVSIVLTGQDDDGDPLTFSVLTDPSDGTLSGSAPNLVYMPAAGFNGSDSFTFLVDDGAVESGIATIVIVVNATGGSGTCATTLGIADSYNGLVFGDFSSTSSDVQGRLAVQGDLSLNWYGLADGLTAETAGTSVVVGGNMDFPAGQIYYGDVIVGGTAAVGANILNGSLTDQAPVPIDFVATKLQMEALSTALSQKPANGTFVFQWGGFQLYGDNSSDLQVFDLDGSDVLSAHTFNVHSIPDDATVIFNISGSNTGLTNMSLQSLEAIRERVLFNFYEATNLTLGGIGVEGSILAPGADINNPQGQVRGTVVAKSWNGPMQLHNHPFAGCLSSN